MSAPTSCEPGRRCAAGPQEVARRHPAGLRGARARRERRLQDVDVHGQKDRSRSHALDRVRHHLLNADLANLVHEEAGDPTLGLPGEHLLARPVAPQADLDVALRRHQTGLDQAVHRRAVGPLHPEDRGAGVGVAVEVDEPHRSVPQRTGTHVGLADRVIPAQHDRDGPGGDHLADGLGDCPVRSAGVAGQHWRVAEVDDPQLREGVDLRLQVRAGRAAGGPDRSRREPGPGAVGHAVVGRRADDGHVGVLQVTPILGHRHPAEAERSGEIRLLAVLAPALQRVDHRATFRCRNVRVASASPYS